MWTFSQRGRFDAPGGSVLAQAPACYSGHGAGLCNPAMEADADIGPIPAGQWRIGTAFDHPHLGPCVMHLTPIGHDAHLRTAFFIHGDNADVDESASHGCIILPRQFRQMVASSPDRTLSVTP